MSSYLIYDFRMQNKAENGICTTKKLYAPLLTV